MAILAGGLALPAAANATSGARAGAHRVEAAAVAPAAAPEAVAYQIDSRHDGDQGGPALGTKSLRSKWTVTLGGTGGGDDEAGDVSYPIIASGRVFVTVENTQSYGSELYALNAATGKREWSVALGGTYGFSALAYDGQRLFALNNDGVLAAFNPSTGHEAWTAALPGYDFTAAPVAYDGAVYVAGAPDTSGGALWSVSEATGRIIWTASVNGVGNSSPAVGSSGVYISLDCQQDYRFSLAGALIWHHSPDRWKFGNGSLVTAPIVDGSVVYVGSSNGTVYGVSATSGHQVWSGKAGSQILPPDEQDADVLIGMAAGGRLLVVPAGRSLTAFSG